MEKQVYHIKIKKEYASALIEDLQQIDAIEIIEEPIPEWQKRNAEAIRQSEGQPCFGFNRR